MDHEPPPETDMQDVDSAAEHHGRRELIGLLEGLAAVFFFALTLPMSRYVVRQVDPVTTGLFRCLVAGGLAAALLMITRQPWPSRRQLKGLAAASVGIVYVYPVFVAWAMKYTPSSHGSVVVGLLPLATAAFASWFGHDRPGWRFWLSAVAGSLVVIVYAVHHGGGALHAADAALLFAVVCSGVAYAEGGYLARSMGGWQVISWVMALNLPLVAVTLTAMVWRQGGIETDAPTWSTMVFMGVFNQYVAFFGWYKAMANVGVARVSQLQLLQPFMTVVIAAVFLHEQTTWTTWLALMLVVATVAIARKAAKKPAVVVS